MKLLTVLVFTLLLVGMAACAQTVTVTGTATISGQPESANVTLTILPKSTVSLALPTSATNTTAGAGWDLAVVEGSGSIGGSLAVVITNGFAPTNTATFHFRHHGLVNAAFCDGHVDSVNPIRLDSAGDGRCGWVANELMDRE